MRQRSYSRKCRSTHVLRTSIDDEYEPIMTHLSMIFVAFVADFRISSPLNSNPENFEIEKKTVRKKTGIIVLKCIQIQVRSKFMKLGIERT